MGHVFYKPLKLSLSLIGVFRSLTFKVINSFRLMSTTLFFVFWFSVVSFFFLFPFFLWVIWTFFFSSKKWSRCTFSLFCPPSITKLPGPYIWNKHKKILKGDQTWWESWNPNNNTGLSSLGFLLTSYIPHSRLKNPTNQNPNKYWLDDR